jgi:integrase
MAKKILAWNDSAQQYYREIGKKADGKSPRFYLGADERQATVNNARLEELWAGVVERWQDHLDLGLTTPPFPCWDSLTLQLANAIRKGEYEIELDCDDPPQEAAAFISDFRTYFPMIQVSIPDKGTLDEGDRLMAGMTEELAQEETRRHRRNMRVVSGEAELFGGKIQTRETLFDALDSYKKWIEQEFVDVTGRTTQTGVKQAERAERIKRHATDMPLSDFGIPEIEAVIDYWRKRPKKNGTEPYSFSLCKHTIRLFKHFLKWLHKSPAFPWKKPIDLELDRIKVVPDKETKISVDVYNKEELRTLWTHATLIERQFLLLALNCGFSISEIGTLDWSMIHGDYIKRVRPKTKVYGEFLLWDITKKALGEPKKKGLVFTTESGLGLLEPTKTNKRGAKIPNTWYRLLNRIYKFDKTFKRLGFHHLRKTSGDLMRRFSDGETMAVHLCHGKPVKTDALAGLYSYPAFE